MSRHSSSVEKNSRKNQLNFIGASQHSKQMYIGNFVYQGVALNTLGNNGLNKSLGNNGLSRSVLVTSGLSMQKSDLACRKIIQLAHVQKILLFCTPMKKCLILKSVKSNSLIHKYIYNSNNV